VLPALSANLYAQQHFPEESGDRARYRAMIETPKAYVSGICILLQDDQIVRGSIINEFGVTALSFSYYPDKEKVKLHQVVRPMDKWYIRRVLRKDLCHLLNLMRENVYIYTDTKYKITYKFTPLEVTDDEIEE